MIIIKSGVSKKFEVGVGKRKIGVAVGYVLLLGSSRKYPYPHHGRH